MSYAFYVDEAHEFVLIRATGTFTETEFVDASKAFYKHPDRKPHFAHVWDARSIDELVMDVTVIEMYNSFLEEYGELSTEGKVAVIVSRTMTEVLSRMLIEINKKWTEQTHRIFQDLEPAAEWLEIPLDAFLDVPEEAWTASMERS